MVERQLPKLNVAGSNPVSRSRRRKLRIACDDFFSKSHPALTPLLLLLRKRSRSARLLGCKRPRDGSLSLPPFLRVAPCYSYPAAEKYDIY